MKRIYSLKNKGFSIVEMMMVTIILSAVIGAGYLILASGESAWFTTETNIQIEEGLRQVIGRISAELQESGSSRDYTNPDPCNSVLNMEVTISNGTGANGTDVLKFSVPVVCEAVDSCIVTVTHGCTIGCQVTISSNPLVIQNCPTSGSIDITQVAHWGAPLTWGCTDYTCMDADNNCATVDYKFIEYRINSSNQLVRRVLDDSSALVREDIFAEDISDFQLSLSADQNVVTMQVSVGKTSALGRAMSATRTAEILLRNRG